MDKLEIKRITIDDFPDYMEDIVQYDSRYLDYQEIYQTNHHYKILLNTKISRIYIYNYEYEEFEGLTVDEINYIIEYFDIKDAHLFNYYYTPEKSLLAIGRIQDGECIY